MDLQFASISDDDISRIIAAAQSGIALTELAQHTFFGKPIQFLKLTTVLYMIQEIDQIFHISGAVHSNAELRDLSELEFLLATNSADYPFPGEISVNVKACLKSYSLCAAGDIREFKQVSFLCRVQLVKHAALSSNLQLIDAIRSSFSEQERNFAEQFLVSLARLSAWFFDASKPNFQHEKWMRYCKAISEHFCFNDLGMKATLQASIANLSANMGHIEHAERILEQNSSIDERTAVLIRMRRAIKDERFELASGLADQLIQIPSPRAIEVDFSRNLAEGVLRRVNYILLSAKIKPFLISGTLLGMAREGRILEHDKDFDIGILGWENQFDVAAALLKSGEFAFSAKDLRGDKLHTLAVRHVPTNTSFDIFFFHDRGDHFQHGIDHTIGYTLKYRFSKFTLVSHEFIGDDFLIPESYRQMLSENYGSDWMTPKPNYFVRLQSPALVRDNPAIFGFVARHEMLDLIAKRASASKAEALIDCITSNVSKEYQPHKKIIDEFFRACAER